MNILVIEPVRCRITTKNKNIYSSKIRFLMPTTAFCQISQF